MERIEYRFIDKSVWNEGPWTDEPDKIQWKDETTGLPCLIRRSEFLGSLCGYVGVSEGHPLFGKNYNEIENVSVHGGLTFSSMCHDDPDHHGICHIPGKDEPDHVWWLGFDCGHFGDLSPGYEGTRQGRRINSYGVYRDISCITKEIEDLAKQLKEMENAHSTKIESGRVV